MKKIKDKKEKIKWPKTWGDKPTVGYLLSPIMGEILDSIDFRRTSDEENYASKFKKKKWYEEK